MVRLNEFRQRTKKITHALHGWRFGLSKQGQFDSALQAENFYAAPVIQLLAHL